MAQKPLILNTQTIARTGLFQIERRDLRFNNGVEVRYERLVGSPRGAVLIVPMLDADTVLLIREYAAGVHRYEIGLPKGLVEVEEDVFAAANRELMEEVGYGSKRLEHIHSLTLAPGYFDFTTHVVLAQQLYEAQAEGDEPERIEVIPWRLDQLDQLLKRDDFSEARSIAALFLARARLEHAPAE